jgi:protein-L-isoaspartate(D-aspartate) O-methyltransferase
MFKRVTPRSDNMEVARRRMVEEQLKGRGITDERVLAAMATVPRHLFVEKGLEAQAYSDRALPIDQGQTISQPYMVALMTQCLELKGGEKVLDVGTGSGYQTAILAELAARVFSVERLDKLASKAKLRLDELGYKNVVVKVNDGSLGWKQFAPFDRIIVSAGAPKVPSTLEEQLAEGGLLVVPVGDSVSQLLMVVRKTSGRTQATKSCACTFVPLVGKEGWDHSR